MTHAGARALGAWKVARARAIKICGANVLFLYSISNVSAGSAFDLDNTIQTLVQRLERDACETVKLAAIDHNLVR
jgi:hypothetical protein